MPHQTECITLEELTKVLGSNFNVQPASEIVLDVIIPIYNAYDELLKCLKSVLLYQDDYRLILINDNSSDRRIHELFEWLRPFLSKRMVLFENHENLGFVKTVNIGMRLSENDVILLNSDTIVTKNWTKKMRMCAYSNDNIATATPFTNNGTICSIPNFCEYNDLPEGFTIESYAQLIENVSMKKYPEIPTAIGFCMLIKRSIINAIGNFDEESFGLGYGEENDFCMRAAKKGYKHVLCDDTFIFHSGGTSFSGVKQKLIEDHSKILNNKYPEYLPLIHQFCTTNPLLPLHKNIKLRMQTCDVSGKKNRILYITHTWGGGTQKHITELIDQLKDNYIFYVLQTNNDKIILTEYNDNYKLIYTFKLTHYINRTHFKDMPYFVDQQYQFYDKEYRDHLAKIIDTFSIELIHVHHLIGSTLDIFNLAHERNIPLFFTIHDYYSICPRTNLIDENLQFCDAENDLVKCINCLSKSLGLPEEFIREWRTCFEDAFAKCDLIIAPSGSVFNILSKYYPLANVTTKVIDHGHDVHITRSEKRFRLKNNKIFHVAMIGSVGYVKGSDVFYQLSRSNKLKNKVKWSVIGVTNMHSIPGYYPNDNVHIYGKYESFNTLRQKINDESVDLVIFPVIWPETFSYSLSEAWASGIPVLVPDLGALGDRVRKTGGGWVVDRSSLAVFEKELMSIINSPDEYQQKLNAVNGIKLKELDEMKKEYDLLYYKYIINFKGTYVKKNRYDNEYIFKSIKYNNSNSVKLTDDHQKDDLSLIQRCIKCVDENGYIYTTNRILIYLTKKVTK